MRFARQNLSKDYAEVTPMAVMLCISAHILDAFWKLWLLGNGRSEWLFILRTRLSTLPKTKKHFWSIWRMNAAQNIEVCPWLYPKAYWATISSPVHRLKDLVNLLLIHIIVPATTNNTYCLRWWLNKHSDKATTQYTYSLLHSAVWIHHLKHQRVWGKLIRMLMITALTQWRLAVHVSYLIS